MRSNVWIRYLPVLRVLFKNARTKEQMLSLNMIDFENAGFRRKTSRFMLEIKNGRLNNVLVNLPLASSLVTTLLEDPAIREITAEREFQVSMNTKFQLLIRNIPIPTAEQANAGVL